MRATQTRQHPTCHCEAPPYAFPPMTRSDTHVAAIDSTKTRPGFMRLAGTAAAAILALATPAAAQDLPADGRADSAAPPGGDGRPAPTPGGPGGSASDEDLEAAVLGGQTTPPPASPSRAGTQRPPVAAVPPPVPARPPAAARPDRGWPAQAHDGGADEEDGRAALAIELATSGLASGVLQGGLFLGARLPVGLIIGGFLDYSSSSVTLKADFTNSSDETASSLFRLGAGARYPLLRTEDGRVELFGAGEVGLNRRTREVSTGGGSSANVSAWGPTLAAGPGLRLWVHEHVAIGYVAEFQVNHLSGDAAAFPSVGANDISGVHAETTDITLVGTFQLLGVF
jgi:hypothetical protein